MKIIENKENPSVAFVTLGCKVNQYETQVMREKLKKNGFSFVEPARPADVYVINTCTVTNVSDRKSRQMIRRCAAANPEALIVVTGCYVERDLEEIRQILKGYKNLILSNTEKLSLDKFLQDKIPEEKDFWKYHGINAFFDQTRAMVKIQDGCDSFCTYCIVPYTRGGIIRSRPVDDIVREVKSLAESGYKEVVLTGIHLGAYGRDMDDVNKLHNVIEAIHPVAGLERIRLSSIEPMDIDYELIKTIANLTKCAHHLHISLQSGSNQILKSMRRGYTRKEYIDLTDRIKNIIPDTGISTDIMVGFPGETDQDFQDTYNLVERVGFNRLHVFRYSPRSGTPAARYPDQVQESIAYQRSHWIRELGDKIAYEFCKNMIGQTAEVLLEEKREGKNNLLAGFTSNYIRVLVADAGDDKAGQIVEVKLTDITGNYMMGLINPA
ncbi:tRNA (N(6)-L-threonylcarbamoyladenosine(37)-C(2))-methylthiotransferase MtaB [Candidatus Poribacteria bacterium]|nr:tRNA (N(6)-L-threonylcarbamoyladenosine(37)-C(2))-methylthiotransferase MtaB [Candidatus Poribacteria bacterium]